MVGAQDGSPPAEIAGGKIRHSEQIAAGADSAGEPPQVENRPRSRWQGRGSGVARDLREFMTL